MQSWRWFLRQKPGLKSMDDEAKKLLNFIDTEPWPVSSGKPDPSLHPRNIPKEVATAVFQWLGDKVPELMVALLLFGLLGLFALVLFSGKSDSQKRTEFTADCRQHGFSPDQCGFLYAMAKDAGDAADQSAAVAGVAAGIAASAAAQSSYRR
jgi:hypothetical protein